MDGYNGGKVMAQEAPNSYGEGENGSSFGLYVPVSVYFATVVRKFYSNGLEKRVAR